jgi:putative transposase
MDITYISMARGFVSLAAVVDWFSRRVLAWKLSITMETNFCIETLEQALSTNEKPEIFNTDQGSQFTSEARASIGSYIDFYNTTRPHSSLKALTPDQVSLNRLPESMAA